MKRKYVSQISWAVFMNFIIQWNSHFLSLFFPFCFCLFISIFDPNFPLLFLLSTTFFVNFRIKLFFSSSFLSSSLSFLIPPLLLFLFCFPFYKLNSLFLYFSLLALLTSETPEYAEAYAAPPLFFFIFLLFFFLLFSTPFSSSCLLLFLLIFFFSYSCYYFFFLFFSPSYCYCCCCSPLLPFLVLHCCCFFFFPPPSASMLLQGRCRKILAVI